MSTPLNPRVKAILVNCSVVAALLYQYWKGTQLFIVLIVGIFALVLVNLLMMFVAKKSTISNN
jgi:hypothetical protein